MGKILVGRDSPGASASAEARSAYRSAARRRVVSGALALAAGATALAGVVRGHPGWLAGSLPVAALAFWWRPEPDPQRWLRGAGAEMATARMLTRLPRRFVVLHDRRPPGSRGNLDHLVIGPSGVWVVDSKVRRARLRIHRGQVWAGDFPIDVAPVARQAARVAEALATPVAAIVAVHGVGLRRRGKKVGGVRVVPAHRLIRHIRRRRKLTRSEVVARAARADRLFPPC
jgi:Nuclease-related domain